MKDFEKEELKTILEILNNIRNQDVCDYVNNQAESGIIIATRLTRGNEE